MPFQFLPIGLATLQAGVAVVIENAHSTAMLESFLMKRVEATFVLQTPDVDDHIIIGMSRGDATVAEIKAAIELTQLERDLQDQANARVVLHETKRMLTGNDGVVGDKVHLKVSLGGGKGIPFDDGDGWAWFAYNAGSNDQVAGAFIGGNGTYYGVWL